MNDNVPARRDILKLLGAAGLFAAAARIPGAADWMADAPASAPQPGVIILVLDSFSAGHAGLYGYQRDTTPNLDQFARRATVYQHAYATSNFTQSSTASLLTGVHPWRHRSLDFYASLLESYERENIFSQAAAGCRTIAYTHNSYAWNILKQLAAGIDVLEPIQALMLYDRNALPNLLENDFPLGFYSVKKWRDYPESNSLFINTFFRFKNAADEVKFQEPYRAEYPLGLNENHDGYFYRLEDTIDWIAATVAASKQPLLGYFHLMPPHEPYKPRADFLNRFAGDGFKLPRKPEHFFSKGETPNQLEADCQRYDEYLAFADSEFGRLVKLLEAGGLLDKNYLIVTSDHGQLFERGIHGHDTPTLYESLIRVPLIVRSPNQNAGINVHAPISMTDLAPTVLNLQGANPLAECEGRLLPALGGEEDAQRVVFSTYARQNAKMKPLTRVTFGAIRYPYKLIAYKGYSGLDDMDELYDLENDPDELDNLAAQKPGLVADLKNELAHNQKLAEAKALGG